MDFIDASFASSTLAAENLPAGVLTNLISQGIIPGIGILIFIPKSLSYLCLFPF
jgi:ferrous iron transport protein B